MSGRMGAKRVEAVVGARSVHLALAPALSPSLSLSLLERQCGRNEQDDLRLLSHNCAADVS